MKKFNSNKIITFCILFLIFFSWLSKSFFISLAHTGKNFISDFNIMQLIENVDGVSKRINCKNFLLDLNSYVMQKSEVRKIIKDDMNVLKLNNGYLCYERKDITDESIKKAADACIRLKNKADELEIPFVYISAPYKLHFSESLGGYSIEDQKSFLSLLNKADIDVINVMEHMENNGVSMEEAFYITDHHWKVETGLWVSQLICQELKKNYGFEYNEENHILDNYDVKVYEDHFLGSIGKKAGRYFTSLGTDDISLITPKFETKYTAKYKDKIVNGDFKDTFLSLDFIKNKDYYSLNPYAAYCHGDLPLMTVENKQISDNGKTFFIIKDSYANTVIPFLSTSTKMLYAIDIRNKIVGDFHKQSVFEYIQQIKPDFIIVLYSGVDITSKNETKYTFE